MTQFVYHNSKHSNINQIFQENLSEYVANLINDFVKDFSKEKTTFATNKTKIL